MKKVIIMNGAAGSGKDFIGNLLNKSLNELSCNSRVICAKQALFELTAKLFNIDVELFNQTEEGGFYSRINKELPNKLLSLRCISVSRMINTTYLNHILIDNQRMKNYNALYINNNYSEFINHFYNITNLSIEQLSKNNNCLSPRQALIFCSEVIVKNIYGADIFGKYLLSELRTNYTIVTDGGFIDELIPLVEADEVSVLVVTIKRKDNNGNYLSFNGDSRNYYLEIFNILNKIINNNNFYNNFLKNEQDFINKIKNIKNEQKIINIINNPEKINNIMNKIKFISYENNHQNGIASNLVSYCSNFYE